MICSSDGREDRRQGNFYIELVSSRKLLGPAAVAWVGRIYEGLSVLLHETIDMEELSWPW